MTPAFLFRLSALSAAKLCLLGLLYFGARPWYLHWGPTESELRARLPGDDLVELPPDHSVTTRAITIQAPAHQVWPWLAQLGQDRGGFYSYELLEDAVGADMPRVERLRPELQRWSKGDKLWMYPPHKL